MTDPNGRVTERFADIEGRVWRIRDAAGNVTKYDYFKGGLLKSITDANGNVTRYAYDGLDRLKTVTDPYNNTTTYTYYKNGALQSRTDGKGQTATYAYDNAGRLTSKSYGTAGAVTFTYEGDRVKTVTDGYHKLNDVNQSYTYNYDARHRLSSVASPTGTVTYTYVSNTRDMIASVSDGTKTWSYQYYEDGSLKKITAPEGEYTYTYNRAGQTDKVTYPNGSNVRYAYDLQHRLTGIQNLGPDWQTDPEQDVISRYAYRYDESRGTPPSPLKGMITSVEETFRHTDQAVYGPYATSYDYDPLYQLTQAAYPNYDDTLNVPWDNQLHGWTYDLIGNRKTYTKTGAGTPDTATYNYAYVSGGVTKQGPQLYGVTHSDPSIPGMTFSYDNNGNLLTQVVNTPTPVTTTYTWDQDDKMTGLTTSDASQSASYSYAHNGDRLRRTLNGTIWNYLYSGEDILKISYPGTPNPDMYFTQGPGIDDVLAETVDTARHYAYKNMLSSVLQLADDL